VQKLCWKDAMSSYDTADALAVSAVGVDILFIIYLQKPCLMRSSVQGSTYYPGVVLTADADAGIGQE
jgi:hypothetical protein